MVVVNMEEVTRALRNTVGKKGMSEDEVQGLAEYLMSFFGFSDTVIDNKLTSNDRDVFYMLEEEGFLTTTQDEVHLRKGKLWRIHYWILKGDQIKRMAAIVDEVIKEPDPVEDLYGDIDESVWSRH